MPIKKIPVLENVHPDLPFENFVPRLLNHRVFSKSRKHSKARDAIVAACADISVEPFEKDGKKYRGWLYLADFDCECFQKAAEAPEHLDYAVDEDGQLALDKSGQPQQVYKDGLPMPPPVFALCVPYLDAICDDVTEGPRNGKPAATPEAKAASEPPAEVPAPQAAAGAA